METIEERPVITGQGVLQTVRHYNYDSGQVTVERKLNGNVIAWESFYLD